MNAVPTLTSRIDSTIEVMVAGRVCPREDIEILRTVVATLKTRDAPFVYSNELLAENKYLSFAEIATGLKAIFGTAKLLVTVRDPQTALRSAYFHELLRFPDSNLRFSEWLDDAIANPRRINHRAESLDQYRYASLLRQFRTMFDDITILRYEDLGANRSAFSAALARVFGADPETIEGLLALPAKNPTRSGLFYRYRELANKLGSLVPFLDLRSSSIARKLNESHCPNMTGGGVQLPKKRDVTTMLRKFAVFAASGLVVVASFIFTNLLINGPLTLHAA
jgi:hypothetical protein